jgi:hypothetical protein
MVMMNTIDKRYTVYSLNLTRLVQINVNCPNFTPMLRHTGVSNRLRPAHLRQPGFADRHDRRLQ